MLIHKHHVAAFVGARVHVTVRAEEPEIEERTYVHALILGCEGHKVWFRTRAGQEIGAEVLRVEIPRWQR